jgi:hypothetical protein
MMRGWLSLWLNSRVIACCVGVFMFVVVSCAVCCLLLFDTGSCVCVRGVGRHDQGG